MKHNARIFHFLALGITLLMAAGCVLLIPKINVNSDMTKYLPDDSQMKHGLDIISTQFSAAQLQNADVKVMIPDVDTEEREYLATTFGSMDVVQAVSVEVSSDSAFTLFNLVVPKSVDQKTFGAGIRERFGEEVIVETSQDGATPPAIVIVIAALLICLVLFAMAQSWLDPLVIMLGAGIAVVLNMGTNAFFPSVSITTNYIASILQLVLSLDYSIILMNRYRQELQPEVSKYASINTAIRRAFRPIISSALTTLVGLLMLLFMRLKIGTDMGLILAKGVACSLFCTFTVLPTLLLIFTSLMQKITKKTFVIPTGRLGRFATHHKTSLAIFSVLLFAGAYYQSRQTDISFSTNGESQIAKVFPKTNPILIIYDVKDEMNVITLADSISYLPAITDIISYPTLLKEQYSAQGLTEYILELAQTMEDYMPSVEGLDMLTPELMQVVYYQHSGAQDTLRVGFRDLMACIRQDCLDNPLFSNVIDSSMREQIQLLDLLMMPSTEEEEETPVETAQPAQRAIVTSPIQPVTINKPSSSSNEDAAPIVVHIATPSAAPEQQPEVVEVQPQSDGRIPLLTFISKWNKLEGSDLSRELYRISDTTRLHDMMNVRQMAEFIGSTPSQTKMVYSFAGEGKRMTPLQYVHFLADDLFQRRALASMVSKEQKQQLILRMHLMEDVLSNPRLSPAEIVALLSPFGRTLDEQTVQAMVYERPMPRPTTVEQPQVALAQAPVPPVTPALPETTERPDSLETTTPAPAAPAAYAAPAPQRPRKTAAERQAELMDKLMNSTKTYTATQMHRNFTRLGQSIDINTVNMLYSYYGSKYAYIDSLTMSTEQMLHYVADTLVRDSAVVKFLGVENSERIKSIPDIIEQNMGMLSNDQYGLLVILTDLPDESDLTYTFIDSVQSLANKHLNLPHYMIGESVMFSEMKHGFNDEMTRITWLTILAIFLIVAISFRSIIVPIILVMTVMTAVFVNVIFSGLISGQMLYLAYLIVQSILMGATIDYGILYTNYYKEYRKTMDQYAAATQAYHGSIRTITTSGLIMVLGPGTMAFFIDDVAISAIVGCLAIGATVSILLILAVLPGVLIAFDKLVVRQH